MKGLKLAGARVWHGDGEGTSCVDAEEIVEALLYENTVVLADLDVLAPHERAKVTCHDQHLFFTVYATHLGEDTLAEHADGGSYLGVSRVSGFVLPRGFVTIRVSLGDSRPFDLTEVMRSWDEAGDLIHDRGSAALVHVMLDVVVDGHFDAIKGVATTPWKISRERSSWSGAPAMSS